jgi:hypothetical protein
LPLCLPLTYLRILSSLSLSLSLSLFLLRQGASSKGGSSTAGYDQGYDLDILSENGLINDDDDDDDDDGAFSVKSFNTFSSSLFEDQEAAASTLNTKKRKTKCVVLRVGGPRYKSRTCRGMRCTACDFEVLRIDGKQWSSKVDYLFFRNNSPDIARLAPELEPSRSCSAYCCQCSWLSQTEMTDLAGAQRSSGGRLRWVCRGH